MLCPRRDEILGDASVFKLPAEDAWHGEEPARTCSYCGGLHPADLFAAIERGDEVIPTDKNYKVYVRSASEGQRKAYFQHLDADDKQAFVKLLNDGKMKIAHPGSFYVLPFFVGR